jgi:vacuolar-type H+-ATPase subunit H
MRVNPAAAEVDDNTLAARAIDHVLQAESAAREVVTACERACSSMLENARQQARTIGERAAARSSDLHRRAAKKLQLCAAAVMNERSKSAEAVVRQLSDPTRLNAAIERLSVRLTTDAAPRDAT